jgi:hypothetical protein
LNSQTEVTSFEQDEILAQSSNGRCAQTVHALWKMFITVKKDIHDLFSDSLLSPFGQAKKKLHHLSRTRKMISMT